MGEQEEKNIPSAEKSDSEVTAHYPHGLTFRDREGNAVIIPHPKHRHSEDKNDLLARDIKYFSYSHPESEEDIRLSQKETAYTAQEKLAEFKRGISRSIGTGTEIEGGLYSTDGRLLTVHGGSVTFEDAPPELYDAQLEIVTGPVGEGEKKKYPSTALEIKDSLVDAVQTGERIADIRGGNLAFASVPEAGSALDLRPTQHEKIITSLERWRVNPKPALRPEVKSIIDKTGLTDIYPFHGIHVHTSNPELSNGQYDTRSAYAAGVLELTQMSEVETFMLYNTKHILGKRIEDVRDVRSILKRANLGSQDTTLPENAHTYAQDAVNAVAEGHANEISRYPVTGTHDRVRVLKEFGTTESVVGAANPDLRLVLAHTYFKQMLRVMSYQALAEKKGDESQVIDYFKNEYKGGKYAHLFNVLPSVEGENSNFQQELKFNKYGFDAHVNGKTYREQLGEMREIVRDMGREYPAFRTQAKIVDHVFGKLQERPHRGMSVAEYLNPETGMKGGILTDYKGDDIEKNISEQAAGTRKQVAMLERVKTEKDLLKFFGIKTKEEVRGRHRMQEKHHRELTSSNA